MLPIIGNMIPEDHVKGWQLVWTMILNMTYHGTDILPSFNVDLPFDKEWKNESNFEEVTFEYMWKRYSKLKDKNGNILEPKPVNELKNLAIPRFLFDCLGSSVFMTYCFPNCKVTYLDL